MCIKPCRFQNRFSVLLLLYLSLPKARALAVLRKKMKLHLAFIVALSFYAFVFSKKTPFEPSCGMIYHEMTFYKVIDGYNCSTKPQKIATCSGKCWSYIYPRMVEDR